MTLSENWATINNGSTVKYSDFKISKSTLFLLTFLVNDLVTHYQYVIPSVKYIENRLETNITSITVKRAIKFLAELGILQKYPRSSTQPLALDLNNCLLRFILAIKQPELIIQKQIQNQLNEDLDDSFLKEVISCRKQLESLSDNLTNSKKTVHEFCEYFLDNFPCSIVNEYPSDELEVRMRNSFEYLVGEEILSLPEQIKGLLAANEENENGINI
ncbi:MAG: hypothetical protein ACTSXA_12655 [Candidatus Heimdallarchaeota archaeon]